MSPAIFFLQLMKPSLHNQDHDPYTTTNDHNAIKITAAIVGVLCVSIAIVMSVFMYRHYLQRQNLTLSASHPIRKRSTSSLAPLITAEVVQRVEEHNVDIENEAYIEEPPSPVMQQGLLQKELVRNYGSNSHSRNNTSLKPPSHHS